MNRKLLGAACVTFALAATLSATSTLTAQTKAETKLYNTALAKGDLKNANKFLAKFPNSVYAPKIQRLKDSLVFNSLNANDVLAYMSFVEENPKSFFNAAANKKIEELNTSKISDSQALEAALQAGMQKEEILAVKGVKNRNVEYVAAISAPKNGYYTITTLAQNNGTWETASQVQESVYTNNPDLEALAVNAAEVEAVTVNGQQHLYFSYTNFSNGSSKKSNIPINDKELVLNLYSMDNNSVYTVMFSGKQAADGNLYGSTMESAQSGLMANPEQTYLLRKLKQTSNLKPYNKELFRTQETIEWWYENNPQNAGNLQFGVIPDDSELVHKFKEYSDKEQVGQYTVAMFDIMNNTVVVVYNKADKKFSLALCQTMPQAENDTELSSFYGEKGNTLVLYYYKGKTPIKKRLNLGSKRMY